MDPSTIELFKKGLKMHKKKNKKPLEVAVKYIVECFERHSRADKLKIDGLYTLLDTLASECPGIVSDPQSDSPPQQAERHVQQAYRLKNLVKQLITDGMAQRALELTTAPCAAPHGLLFVELQMQVYHSQGNMEEFWKIVQVLQSEQKIAYAETYYIWGISLMESGGEENLKKSIDVFSKGMTMAERDGIQFLVERMAKEKMKTEKQLKSHEATPKEAVVQIAPLAAQEATRQAVEEAKRHEIENELLVEEAAESARNVLESKKKKNKAKKQEKKKGIQISEVKKAVEVDDESDRRVLEGEKDEKRSGSKLVEESRPLKRKFEVALDVTMEDLDERSSMGSTKTNTTEVRKSFIVA